jgi:hypothetical protein
MSLRVRRGAAAVVAAVVLVAGVAACEDRKTRCNRVGTATVCQKA